MSIEIIKCEGYWLAVRGDETGTGVTPSEALSNLEFLHGESELRYKDTNQNGEQ